MPIRNQTISRTQVVKGSADIKAMAETAPAGATNQTAGVVNLQDRSGSRTRSTSTPTETITNARRVPIEQRLPASRTVNMAEKNATPKPVTMDVIHGVRKRGCTRLTTGGSQPSRAML